MGFRSTCMLRIGGTITADEFADIASDILDQQPQDAYDDNEINSVEDLAQHLTRGETLRFEEVMDGAPLPFVQELAEAGLQCAWWSRDDMGVDPIVHLYDGTQETKTFACDADEQQIVLLAQDLRRADFDADAILAAQDMWDAIPALHIA